MLARTLSLVSVFNLYEKAVAGRFLKDCQQVHLRHVQCAARPRFSENATALSSRATRTMITG